MGTSLTLFRVWGIDVRIHWSFLLILVYGAFAFGDDTQGLFLGALYGVFVTLLLFICVTLHEFGHALVAKHFKVNVPSITLLPIGGVASLERMPDKPVHELLITIAGPLVNFAIAVLLIPFVSLSGGTLAPTGSVWTSIPYYLSSIQRAGLSNLITYLIVTNVLLGLFNLLPAFPMDGGRILRSLLAMTLPYVQATRIAVFVGRLMAALFAIWGIMGGGIFMLLIAFFVYVGGSAEREAVESRAILKKVCAENALTANAVSLYASERLSRAMDLLMTSYQTDYPVLDLSGQFIGALTRQLVLTGLKRDGPDGRIVDVMLTADQVPNCGPRTSLADVRELMGRTGLRVVAVMDRGRFVGLLTIDDINEIQHVMSAALENPKARRGDRSTSQSQPPSQETVDG